MNSKLLALLFAAAAACGSGCSPTVTVQEGAQAPAQAPREPQTHHFTSVATLYGDTKFWQPATFVAVEGDTVSFTLKNAIPESSHGFAIEGYDVEEVVETGKDVKVELTADKAGTFRIYCQLHQAHVGGQLIVLPAR